MPEFDTLETSRLRVHIRPLGAELVSFVDTINAREHIWQSDPAIWARHAPLLFPIVGRLADDHYSHQGRSYPLSQHGFARDLAFTCIDRQPHRLVYRLRASESTRERYPFDFELDVAYAIAMAKLEITYTVKNPGQETLPFSIGAHPGFVCPWGPGERFSDYAIEFERSESQTSIVVEHGLRTGAVREGLANRSRLRLSYRDFDRDALIFSRLRSQWVVLRNTLTDAGIRLDFPGFPYFALWTKPQAAAPFICLEPWFGIADRQGPPGELSDKEGIVLLSPGASFNCSHSLSLVSETERPSTPGKINQGQR